MLPAFFVGFAAWVLLSAMALLIGDLPVHYFLAEKFRRSAKVFGRASASWPATELSQTQVLINAAVTGDVGYQHGLPACRVLFLASEEGCQPAFRIVGLPSVPQDLFPKPSAYLGKWVKKPRRGNFIRSKKTRGH
jgi:hypothetical protein